MNTFTSSRPTLWLKSSRNCSGGWRGLVGGFSYYIKIFCQIYFIKIYIWKRGKPKSATHRRMLMPIWFHSLIILPGSAAGAAALKSGDAVRWWLLSIALATRGRAGAADPPKILQPAGVFTFLGVRGGRKEGKICRCVLEVLVGRFLVGFWSIFHNFLVLSTRKNRVIYNVFVPLASKKSFWQHAGNCVNTSVFARPGPQNTVNTVIFARRGSKPRKYRGFALARSQKHRYLRCFFVPRMWKIAKTPPIWRILGFAKTVDLTILRGLQKSTNYKDNNDNDHRTKQQQL